MADVAANIILTTTGGDEAAAEVAKADQAVQGLVGASGGLQAKFQERFQHVGLMIFAGDALRASGLGAETRMVVNSLNLALTEGAAAAGLSSGGLMLVVAALVAVAAIAVKVIGHHKDLADSIQKEIDANQKEIDSINTTINSMNEYVKAGGKLTASQKEFHDAAVVVAGDLATNQVDALNRSIDALTANRSAILNHAQALAAWHAYVADAKVVWDFLVDALKNSDLGRLEAQVIKVDKAILHWVQSLLAIHTAVAPAGADLDHMNDLLDKNALALAKDRMEIESLERGTKLAWNDMTKEVEGNAKEREAIDKKVTDFSKAQLKEVHNAYTEAFKKREEEEKKSQEKMASEVKSISDQMGRDVGNAFAKMIVEGKSFTEEMKAAFKSMAEQIISDIVRMIVEWEILTSLGFPTTGGGGFVNLFGGGFATGGSAVADTPTLALFGEAGPEVASFAPLGSAASYAASSAGGSNSQYNNVTVNVSGVIDQRMVGEIGRQIVQSIRGQGQLPFTAV